MLPDGSHDVIVVDAEAVDGGGLSLELTVLGGPHKGDVVTVRTTGSDDPVSLLGIPGVLTVEAGTPSVRLEP